MPACSFCKKSGFTLIEILVVISIIGILLSLSFSALYSSRASARDLQRKGDLERIRSALEIYRADCGSYPLADLSYNSPLLGTGAVNCPTTNVYMSKLPSDPLNATKGYQYRYVPGSGNATYTLCTYLEHGGTTSLCAGLAGATCGTLNCNYSTTNQ